MISKYCCTHDIGLATNAWGGAGVVYSGPMPALYWVAAIGFTGLGWNFDTKACLHYFYSYIHPSDLKHATIQHENPVYLRCHRDAWCNT